MSKPVSLTDAHRVAFIFLYFASETDQKLASEEMIVISDKIENCINESLKKVDNLNLWNIITESLNWFNALSLNDKQITFYQLMDFLKVNFSDNQKNRILEDLKVLAKSDGIFLEAEKALIDKSAELLN
ncbi:MAG: hypothetical protein CMF96_01270 [Candidatus Marinimicrobia bacterium]|nr:hypothetical protein [Candidatus Neomarinimicrobiota bacterium]|tara:strand:+ start:6470 stop:6856 length:387 start_codon:yes stop_codon:yes gene_type:complete